MTALETIDKIASDARGYLNDLRQKSGKKFIGVMHAVVPQELLYAAGLHPFRLYPFPGVPTTAARAHLHVDTSSIFRAIWDQVLKNQYSFMDGVVLPESCETVTYFARGWSYHRPDDCAVAIAGVRFSKTPNAVEFVRKEFERLAETMRSYFGVAPSDDSLRQAITTFNKNRELLRAIYDLRKSPSPALTGVEALKISMVSQIMDREESNRLLEQLLRELKEREGLSRPAARLMVSGPCITDVRLLETFEASGALVVIDDTNSGYRAFSYHVEQDAEPLMALAQAYQTVPCPFSTSAEERLSIIRRMAAEYSVDGIVFAIEKACEAEKMDFPYLEKELRNESKVPVTFIETEYLCDMAPIRTRIDAFVESLS